MDKQRPRCPGQNTQFWKPEDIYDITCPYCRADIEFWKDEPVRVCPQCNREVRNPKIDLGCAKWCKYAKECLGVIPEESETALSVCARIVEAIKKSSGTDTELFHRLMKSLDFAEQILVEEREISPLIVKCAVLLSQMDFDAGRQVLLANELRAQDIGAIGEIIGSIQNGRSAETRELGIVEDALRLAGLLASEGGAFKTAKGRELSLKISR